MLNDSQIKYWLLTTEYPPFHGGGISTYCYHTAKMLAQYGINVTVFVADNSVKKNNATSAETNIKINRFNINSTKSHASLGYTARLSFAFAEVVKNEITQFGKPDYIEAQDYLGIAYYLLQMKHLQYDFIKDVSVIITLHSPAFIYLEYNRVPVYRLPDFWTCEMEKNAILSADILLSPSRFLLQEIQKFIDISSKIKEVIPNPFYISINKNLIGKPKTKIIYYGKLSAQKGTFELLPSFAALWENGFEKQLYFIGGTDIVFHPEMKTMGQLVKQKYKKYIQNGLLQMIGKITPVETEAMLMDALVVIIPSIVDNLPYTAIEAMALGNVVLVSKQGGQSEIIEDGKNGFVFDHSVHGDFEKKLHGIILLPAFEINQIGLNAQAAAKEKYAYISIAKQKILLINQLKTKIRQTNIYPFIYQEPIKQWEQENENSFLSVVVPYFNMGVYINDCINSILKSSYKEIEILIIDDGSTQPESIKKLGELSKNKSIKIITQKNAGLAECRNRGAKESHGKYLAFLDADDIVSPEYYTKAINVLNQFDNVFFVGCWVRYFENSNKLWPSFTPQPPYILLHNSVNSSSLVYKKQAFINGGLNDKKTDYGLEDYESVINMLHHGFNGIVLPEELFYYRVRNNSMSRSMTIEKNIYSYKYISEKHAEYFAKFAAQIVNLLNANGPGYYIDNPTFGMKINVSVEKENRFIQKAKIFIKKHELLKKTALVVKKKLNL